MEPESETRRVGLCARCRWARTVPSRTTVFWLCERSLTDPSFDKYPRLPILSCRGFEEGEGGSGGPAEPAG